MEEYTRSTKICFSCKSIVIDIYDLSGGLVLGKSQKAWSMFAVPHTLSNLFVYHD